jgi:YHS domain-containing protein
MKLTSFLLSVLLVPAAVAADSTADTAKNYPLKTCIVSDESLGDEPVDYIHKETGKPDRLVRFCCDGCIEDFKADPARYLAKLDSPAPTPAPAPAPAAPQPSASIDEQKARYPLTVCAVSGEALGSMGDPFEYVHQEPGQPDRLVRMCCKGCLKTFNKTPAKYLARIDAAAKAPREAQP